MQEFEGRHNARDLETAEQMAAMPHGHGEKRLRPMSRGEPVPLGARSDSSLTPRSAGGSAVHSGPAGR